MSQNLLHQETSPYLLQHADNPVDWMPWGPEAFEKARQEDKPVLLSVGYAACHWCHVMAHESFEDPEIASRMNELFVSIKVDREERPDLDLIYQQALALLGQHGGWPLTMFLTPDGHPFWGGTYFPPADRYGRPGFPAVLSGVARAYREERTKVSSNVNTLKDALDNLARNKQGSAIDINLLNKIAERLVREIDPIWGGIGQAPKFPQSGILELLWRAWRRTGQQPFATAVETTLIRMCQGGIYDHIGGGFARYSVDDQWLVPHFEKMLYDNAQLIDILTLVWQGTKAPLFKKRVEQTVEWIEREMIGESGAFASTLDADSEGEEGRFYVWSESEIDRVLGDDATLFKEYFDVTPYGNWEGHTILNRRQQSGLAEPDIEARLDQCCKALLAQRAGRIRPGWDDKILADWNGLMIAALSQAGFVFNRPDWISLAERAFHAILETHFIDGVLHHSARSGRTQHRATVDDYANLIRAAISLYEITSKKDYLNHAMEWSSIADRLYWDPNDRGYFLTAVDAEQLIVRSKSAHDNAVPSGNGTMVGNLARLYYLTGNPTYRHRAEETITAFSGEVERNFFPLATLLNNAETLISGVQVVIVGDAVGTLTEILRNRDLPGLILERLSPDTALPTPHPAAGKGMVDGKPTAYVCRDMTCSLPVTTPEALADLLANTIDHG